MTITTTFVCPPIPNRSYDWRADWSICSGADGGPVGWGETKEEAVRDLLRDTVEDDSAALDALLDMAFETWKREQEERDND